MDSMPPPGNPLRAGMATELSVDPCVLTILGASGDLTRRKLLPGLYALAENRLLPSAFGLLGFARRPWSDEKFRKLMREAVGEHSRVKPVDDAVWDDLAKGMGYVQGSFDDPDAYVRLRERLERYDAEHGTAGGRTFYLAVPPGSAGTIVEQLKKAGLVDPPVDGKPYARVVIEKPFGIDLESAVALNRDLLGLLDERQIFRIDHYLGKETVQNLLVLRFGNTIFEPLWSRNHVSHVEITVAEHIGIEGRGKFYEQTGLMRDVVQNHAMQLFCLVAMEAPVAWDADSVRDEKVKALRSLRPIRGAQAVREQTVRGQYAAGTVRGDAVSAYRKEPDVDPASMTETFVALQMEADNWRWAGVPFYLRAGKRLSKRVTEIALHFKALPHPLFSGAPGAMNEPNTLILRIQPDEGIALRFATKIPGQSIAMREVAMDFRYGTAFGHATPEAYERLLLDTMRGDATLFTRHDEVEAQWAFVDPIMQQWKKGDVRLARYESGSWGPDEAHALIARLGHAWSRP